MRHRPWTRALGALVAVVLLGAVAGASDLDAFLFHPTGASAAAAVPHVEAPAHADCHADRCLLALVLANRGVASTPRTPVRFGGVARRAAAASPHPTPRPFRPGRRQQPRAPPPPLA